MAGPCTVSMTQPALTRVIARLERQLGARLFERTPKGVRLTALGAALVEPAQRVLREIETAQGRVDAARSGRAGRFRVTANPTWEAVLPHAIARFHERFPAVELDLETATRVEGLRLLAEGRSDLHCGGIDSGEALPTHLRRERFLDMTAGIVAWRGHPLLGREITDDDLARSPWTDYDAPAMAAPGASAGRRLPVSSNASTRARTRACGPSSEPAPPGCSSWRVAPISPGSRSPSSNASPARSCSHCRSSSGATSTARASSPGA